MGKERNKSVINWGYLFELCRSHNQYGVGRFWVWSEVLLAHQC